MALRKIFEVEGEGFIATELGSINLGPQKTAFTAYCSVSKITGTKKSGQVTIECKADRYVLRKEYHVPFSVSENAPNFIKQAYLYLKSLPEWADAVDC